MRLQNHCHRNEGLLLGCGPMHTHWSAHWKKEKDILRLRAKRPVSSQFSSVPSLQYAVPRNTHTPEGSCHRFSIHTVRKLKGIALVTLVLNHKAMHYQFNTSFLLLAVPCVTSERKPASAAYCCCCCCCLISWLINNSALML